MSSVPFEMRRSLVVKDGNLRFCDRRNVSCYNWLVKEEGMTEEEFASTVHGAYYPGRVYFYKGVNTADTDEEVERTAEHFRDKFNSATEICCGAIPAEEGTVWEPRKSIGYGTQSIR